MMTIRVDWSLLSKEERAEYSRLRRAPLQAYGAALWRAILWALPVGGLSWLAETSSQGGYNAWANIVWIAVVIVGLWGLISSAGAWAERAETSTKRNVEDFLWRIGYSKRTRKESGVAGPWGSPAVPGDSEPTTSIRQAQHQWYKDHSELNWRDRERAEMYGMDVETYISNVLENDKD